MPMPKKRFWDLIDSSRLAASGDAALQHELLTKRLRRFSPANIVAYQRRLDEYCRAAATKELLNAVQKLDPDFGADDDFDDLCHWIVSRGKETYNAIVADPSCLREYVHRNADGRYEYYFTLFGNAYQVYEEKTGRFMPRKKPPQRSTPKRTRAAAPVCPDNLQVKWCKEFEPHEDRGRINCIAINREHSIVAAGGRNGQVKLWTLRGKLIRFFDVASPAHSGGNGVCQIILAPDRNRLVTFYKQSLRHTLTLWDLTRGDQLATIQQESCWHPPAISPDGRLAVTVFDGSIRVWSLTTGKVKHELAKTRTSHTFAANSDLSCVVGSGSPRFRVWNARTGKELLAFRGNKQYDRIVMSPDGRFLFGDNGHAVPAMIWDVKTGKRVPNPGGILRGEFSPDSRLVADSCFKDEYQLKIWDLETTKLLHCLDVDDEYFKYAFAGDNSLLTTVSDGTVHKWDALAGRPLASVRLDNRSKFDCVSSADGKAIFVSDGQSLYCLHAR